MQHVKAFLIKWVMITAVLWIVLTGFFGVSFINMFAIGIIVTGASYLTGDLLILPKSQNWVASIADFVLAFAIIWLLGSMLFAPNVPLGTAAFISALIIAIGEMFFHGYMIKTVLPDHSEDEHHRIDHPKGHLQAEFGEEIDPRPTRLHGEDDQK